MTTQIQGFLSPQPTENSAVSHSCIIFVAIRFAICNCVIDINQRMIINENIQIQLSPDHLIERLPQIYNLFGSPLSGWSYVFTVVH